MCRPDKGYVTVSPTLRGIASIAIPAEAVAACAVSTIGYVLPGRSAAAILPPSNATESSRERMNRGDLQLLAELRVEDARILLEAGRFAGAYYLLGYAVECALKACVAKLTREHDFPDKQLVLDSYTHDLEQLLQISGVEREFDARVRANRAFSVDWTTVKDWTEAARYDNNISVGKTRELLKAVTDAESGVLTWLKTVW